MSFCTSCALQEKALSELDKDDSPAELNESDSEEVAVDQEKALAEKEKVKIVWAAQQYMSKRINNKGKF